MKSQLFLLPLYVAMASCAKLNNNYIPPSSAAFAGGNGNFLAAPAFSGSSTSFAGASSAGGFRTAEGNARILSYNNDNDGTGSYSFGYQTDNRISHNEAGRLKGPESEEVRGSFSYTSPEGQVITLNYVADETGFHPTGDHLPTPPPIPAEILKSLQGQGAAASFGGSFASSQSGYRY